MTKPLLVVVVPVYSHWDFAQKAVASALETPDSHVLVVDDGSPDPCPKSLLRLSKKCLHVHRFPNNKKSITRSWNYGVNTAVNLGATYVCLSNSDVIFPSKGDWFEPMRALLAGGRLHLVGPVTNAPGHRDRQRVSHWFGAYSPSDNQTHVDMAQSHLYQCYYQSGKAAPEYPEYELGPINGFTMVGKTQTFKTMAHAPGHAFNEKMRLIRSEDELIGRWTRAGLRVGFTPASYVWHYRGVTRKGATRGESGRGWYRPAK